MEAMLLRHVMAILLSLFVQVMPLVYTISYPLGVHYLPARVELNFDKEIVISRIEIKFDSNLNKRIYMKSTTEESREWKLPLELVRDYEIQVSSDGTNWCTLLRERGNYQRFRRHNFSSVSTKKLRLKINATHGCPSARVFEVRVY